MKEKELFEALGGKVAVETEDETPVLRVDDRQLSDTEREVRFALKDGGTAKVNSRYAGEPTKYVNDCIACALLALAYQIESKQKDKDKR